MTKFDASTLFRPRSDVEPSEPDPQELARQLRDSGKSIADVSAIMHGLGWEIEDWLILTHELDGQVASAIPRAPNQNCPKERKEKIRHAMKRRPTVRGKARDKLRKDLSRWRMTWPAEYAEVEAEFKPESNG